MHYNELFKNELFKLVSGINRVKVSGVIVVINGVKSQDDLDLDLDLDLVFKSFENICK